MQHQFISTLTALDDICGRMSGAEMLALDTEFVRVRTYFPALCLIQITAGDEIYCVDTVAIEDIAPLLRLAREADRPVIIHSGRQDFEAIHQRCAALPRAIWDTQIAAALLGYGEQVSYAQLVAELCQVELAKSQTRTNWAQRPLTPAQLSYAAEDVAYLIAIRDTLYDKLASRDRLGWLEEECAALLRPDDYEPDAEGAWRRCKTRQRLGGHERGAWKALCALREGRAVEKNRPRRWLLADAAIEDLAGLAPEDKNAIARVLRQAKAERQFSVDEVAQTIAAAPVSDEPRGIPPVEEKQLIDKCLKFVRGRAKALEMSASLLATRRDVGSLVQGSDNSSLLSGWRREVIGEELLAHLGR